MPSRKLTVVVVAALLLLAGCAGVGEDASGGGDGAELSGGGGGGGSGSGDGGQAAPESQAVEDSGDDGASASAQVDAADRAIVRTGRMVLEVENFSESQSAIAATARNYGGYVSDSNERLHRSGDQTYRTGEIVVRVPSEEYEAMQADAAAEGTVINEETQTKDVTDQLVDLEARLENLRQRRDRLRSFYDRANDTEELLRIEKELSDVQGEIERLEAEKRSLEQRVAYSTLRVELREPSPGPSEVSTRYHEQSLSTVFFRSVRDIYVFGRATLVTIAGAAPWLAVLAVPVLGARRLLRGRSLPVIGGSQVEAATRDSGGAGRADDGGTESESGNSDAETGASADEGGPDETPETED